MAQIGTFTRGENGTYTGEIRTLTLRVVQLDAQIFKAGIARRLSPARAELDAAGADPMVGRLVVLALARPDGRLEAHRGGAGRYRLCAGC